jgi:hypothetical protein
MAPSRALCGGEIRPEGRGPQAGNDVVEQRADPPREIVPRRVVQPVGPCGVVMQRTRPPARDRPVAHAQATVRADAGEAA